MHEEDECQGKISCKVLVNSEEQYSLWPAHDDTPGGWRDVGQTGSKDVCAAYIENVWTDMRPKSLRERMENVGKSRQANSDNTVTVENCNDGINATVDYQDLVSVLSCGEHPVVAGMDFGSDAGSFRRFLDKGFVYITFTRTSGGTELGVALDKTASGTGSADFEAGTGNIHLAGDLTINGQEVRCIADIDIVTLEGMGHLEVV